MKEAVTGCRRPAERLYPVPHMHPRAHIADTLHSVATAKYTPCPYSLVAAQDELSTDWRWLYGAAKLAAWSGLCYHPHEELVEALEREGLQLVAYGRTSFTCWCVGAAWGGWRQIRCDVHGAWQAASWVGWDVPNGRQFGCGVRQDKLNVLLNAPGMGRDGSVLAAHGRTSFHVLLDACEDSSRREELVQLYRFLQLARCWQGTEVASGLSHTTSGNGRQALHERTHRPAAATLPAASGSVAGNRPCLHSPVNFASFLT